MSHSGERPAVYSRSWQAGPVSFCGVGRSAGLQACQESRRTLRSALRLSLFTVESLSQPLQAGLDPVDELAGDALVRDLARKALDQDLQLFNLLRHVAVIGWRDRRDLAKQLHNCLPDRI